jgi:hypothetical protein
VDADNGGSRLLPVFGWRFGQCSGGRRWSVEVVEHWQAVVLVEVHVGGSLGG